MLEYELTRSKRKTLALYVRRDGRVEVRAPLKTSKAYIDDFVIKKRDWIENTRSKLSSRQTEKQVIELTSKEEAQYKKQAKEYLQQRCLYFSEVMGLQHGTVKINSAKTRWGSCNRRGDINFTYRLLFAPEELIDYVVVHELAHLKEMNHSARFWSVVGQTMPDYKTRRKKLREFEHQVELVII
ncbi:MAG TPA: SprT family zinc-dependent metalloprotease [Anaerovoracaceae bacterium]|nr:SprT family zinc-dependent metalloprotease [Anaerovoracaceae bacterium]